MTRTQPHAPALDVVGLVMKGRINQVVDFSDPAAATGSLAAPAMPFGQLLAAAFDEAVTAPSSWPAVTVGSRLARVRRLLELATWR